MQTHKCRCAFKADLLVDGLVWVLEVEQNSRVNPVAGVEVIGAANRDDTGAVRDWLCAELIGAGVARQQQQQKMHYISKVLFRQFLSY